MPHESLYRIDTGTVILELIGRGPPPSDHDVYEEPMHVIALQQPQPFKICEGRYQIPRFRQDYSSIGRLLVLPAATPLEVRTPSRPDQVVRCMFSPDLFDRYGDGCDLYDPGVLANCLNLRHKGIADTLTRLGNELRSPGLGGETLIEALGLTLMIEFARYVSSQGSAEPRHRGGLSRRHLRLITDAVESEVQCPSLSDLSRLSGLSLRHLTRAFKQTTGTTVYDYVEQVRLQKAKALLADTDLLMKDIAFRLGFSCASSLSVAFRKLAGEAPRDYRKRVRGVRDTDTASSTRH